MCLFKSCLLNEEVPKSAPNELSNAHLLQEHVRQQVQQVQQEMQQQLEAAKASADQELTDVKAEASKQKNSRQQAMRILEKAKAEVNQKVST